MENRHSLTLPVYHPGPTSVGSDLQDFEDALAFNWNRKTNYNRLITRERLNPALADAGIGLIDLEGVFLQRIGNVNAANLCVEQLERLPHHAVDWPIREWVSRGITFGAEIHAIRDRPSSSAIGFIGFKRDVLCDYDDDRICIEIPYHLSAIYIAPDYVEQGLATALFHSVLADMELTFQYMRAACPGLRRVTGLPIEVSFALTGEAHSFGGARCAKSLHRAMTTLVSSNIRGSKRSRSISFNVEVTDDFDYGSEMDWRDRHVDEGLKAA